MKIVLTGTEAWAIDSVRRSLEAAGNETLACFNEPSFGTPCRARCEGLRCPGTTTVDVILAVRAHPLPHLTRLEQSTADCPMLADVPVVLAGSTVHNPFGPRTAGALEGYEGIEGACRDAIEAVRAPRTSDTRPPTAGTRAPTVQRRHGARDRGVRHS